MCFCLSALQAQGRRDGGRGNSGSLTYKKTHSGRQRSVSQQQAQVTTEMKISQSFFSPYRYKRYLKSLAQWTVTLDRMNMLPVHSFLEGKNKVITWQATKYPSCWLAKYIYCHMYISVQQMHLVFWESWSTYIGPIIIINLFQRMAGGRENHVGEFFIHVCFEKFTGITSKTWNQK